MEKRMRRPNIALAMAAILVLAASPVAASHVHVRALEEGSCVILGGLLMLGSPGAAACTRHVVG
jgi:hypothetical protein